MVPTVNCTMEALACGHCYEMKHRAALLSSDTSDIARGKTRLMLPHETHKGWLYESTRLQSHHIPTRAISHPILHFIPSPFRVPESWSLNQK